MLRKITLCINLFSSKRKFAYKYLNTYILTSNTKTYMLIIALSYSH